MVIILHMQAVTATFLCLPERPSGDSNYASQGFVDQNMLAVAEKT
ncbi:MAG: hypothetical protein ACJAWI_002739 [Marinomonas primoryensis]|jgi:hypothetical protein